MKHEQKRIVVIGGGYVGALAAVRAAGRSGRRGAVTLINPEEGFVQRLRLHQVATGQRVAAPELTKLCGRRVEQVRGWADSIDLDRGAVTVSQAHGQRTTVPYDQLIVATGSVVDTVTVPGVSEYAHALSDVDSSQRLEAALTRTPEGGQVAVVGAGLTGLEAASEIAEARPDLQVSLVSREALGERFSAAGRKHLDETFDNLGVEVQDGVEVAAVGSGALEPGHGSSIPFDLAVWCGGFVPRALAAKSGLATGRHGGAVVDRRMRSVSHSEVLVVGDAAECPTLTNGAKVRMSCQAGMPTGAHAADVVAASIRDREEKEFDFGYIGWNVSLGRKDGLIQWVDRTDRPKERVTRGRRAAWLKEFVTAGGVKSARWERRVPGAVRWLSAGSIPDGEAQVVEPGGEEAHISS